MIVLVCIASICMKELSRTRTFVQNENHDTSHMKHTLLLSVFSASVVTVVSTDKNFILKNVCTSALVIFITFEIWKHISAAANVTMSSDS